MWALLFVSIVGFLAQFIDGSMGMAFGVTATSLLLLLAYNPATASAIVHLAEVATTAVSGLYHIRFGNVHWPTILKLAIPGAVGAFLGAVVLSSLDLTAARPWTSAILLVLGIVIIRRFVNQRSIGTSRPGQKRWLIPLGLFGGLVDSTGGGGWGPVVTTSLTLSRVLEPRKAIGTTNTTEFVVALSASVGFLWGLGANVIPWSAVLALLTGGVIAAPVAAWLVSRISQRTLGVTVGFLIVLLNTRQLLMAFDFPEFGRWFVLAFIALTGLLSLLVLRRLRTHKA